MPFLHCISPTYMHPKMVHFQQLLFQWFKISYSTKSKSNWSIRFYSNVDASSSSSTLSLKRYYFGIETRTSRWKWEYRGKSKRYGQGYTDHNRSVPEWLLGPGLAPEKLKKSSTHDGNEFIFRKILILSMNLKMTFLNLKKRNLKVVQGKRHRRKGFR